MPPRYGRLEVVTTADTSGMERSIKQAATASGQQAAKGISSVMSAGLKGLGGVAGAVGKSVATGLGVAGAAAVGFGVSSFKAAARVGEMNATLRALAKANNLSYDAMTKQVGAIRHQGVEYGVAQNVVAQFARNQLDLGKSTDLATVAQNAAVISGQNSSDTLDQLIHGITTQNSLVLRNAGVNVQAGQAMDIYAKKLGKSRKELTDSERAQAVLNGVIEAGGPIAGAYAAAMEEPGKVLRSFPRVINDVMVAIGQGLVDAIGPAILKGYAFAKSLTAALEPGGALAPVISAIGEAVAGLIGPVAGFLDKWSGLVKHLNPETMQAVADKIKQFGPAALIAGGGLAAMTAPAILSGIPLIGPIFGNLLAPFAAVKDALFGIGKAAIGAIPAVSEAGGVGKALAGAFGPVAAPLLAVAAVFAALMIASPKFREAVLGVAVAIGKALMPVVGALVDGFKLLAPPLMDAARQIGDSLAPSVATLIPLIGPLGKIVGGVLLLAFRALRLILALIIPVVTTIVRWIAAARDVLIPLTVGVLAGVVAWYAYQAALWVVNFGGLAVQLAGLAIKQGIVSAATSVMTAAQWLWNAAMTANPIGIVVVAIAALVAAIVFCYMKFDVFRAVVDNVGRFLLGVWNATVGKVVAAIATLWHWITGNSPGLIPAFLLLAAIVSGAVGAVRAACVAAFNAVAAVVAGTWNTVRSTTAAVWGWAVGFTRAMWAALSGAVASALGAIRAAVSGALSFVRGLVTNVWTWARDFTAQIWQQGIVGALRAAWGAIQGAVQAGGQWVMDKLRWVWDQVKATAAGAWEGIVGVIRSAWTKVQDTVAAPARFVAFKIINPLVKGINVLVTKVGIPAIPEIPAFAEGGRIPGGWGGGDRHVILAEAGEWMLTKRQARAIGYDRLRGLPRYAEGGEIGVGHPSHGPQLRGPFDFLGDLGGKIARIAHVDDLLRLGANVVDTFSGMLKWAAAQAFKAATEPLRKLATPYAEERVPPGNVIKQYTGKLAIDIIDKAIAFIESKAAAECEAGGVVAHAMTFDGKPYRWGGPANPRQGFDCSSFVSFIAGSAGLPLPNGFKVPAGTHGPVTGDYLRSGVLKTIGRGQTRPGDVAVNDRHIGFIIGPGGAGFAARSTATGIGKQSFASGYTYRTWGGAAAGEGTCEGGTGPDGPPNGFPPGVKGFAAMVAQVCRMLGIPQATNAFLSQMKSESNGNPRAINNWDSNAKRGTPSKGLLQLIDPTFLAYAGPYKSRGIWDPFANIYAGVNYAKSRYGSRLLQVIGHGHGYAHGGIISEHVVGIGQQTGDIYHIGEAGYPEMVTPLNGSTAEPGPFTRDRGGGGGTVINVYPQAGQSEEQIAAAVGRRLAWAEAGGRT